MNKHCEIELYICSVSSKHSETTTNTLFVRAHRKDSDDGELNNVAKWKMDPNINAETVARIKATKNSN
jgi:hypothetical protein